MRMEDREVEILCDRCGEEIYDGEEYYRVDGQIICTDCVAEYARRLLWPCRMGGQYDR